MSLGAGRRKTWVRIACLGAAVLGLLNLVGMVVGKVTDSQRGPNKHAESVSTSHERPGPPPADRMARPQRRLRPSLRYRGMNRQGHKEYLAADGSVLIHIPAGSYLGTLPPYSTDPATVKSGKRNLPGFYIGKFEVTNAQFQRFADDVGFAAVDFNWLALGQRAGPEHPVVYASCRAARFYCAWAGLRLPTVAEWERAARGTDGRPYPWGQEWNPNLCNSFTLADAALKSRQADFSAGRGPLPTGTFPGGASPCGALDMVGNVAEWCADDGGSGDARSDPFGNADWRWRMLCGGSWDNFPDRCTLSPPISAKGPDHGGTYAWGFRVALSE